MDSTRHLRSLAIAQSRIIACSSRRSSTPTTAPHSSSSSSSTAGDISSASEHAQGWEQGYTYEDEYESADYSSNYAFLDNGNSDGSGGEGSGQGPVAYVVVTDV